MADTSITLHARAVDQTGKVFAGIRKSLGSIMRTVGVGVAAGAGAFGAIVKQLGELSDLSARAGTSASDITRLSTALGVIGVKSASVEQVTQAFERMARATGATGLGGFRNVLKAIAELPTTMDRAKAAVQVFGRAGAEYMPIIEQIAQNGVQSLNDVIDGMPAVSQAAADSGDAMADAWSTTWAWVRSQWMETVGAICSAAEGDLEGGIRGVFSRAVVHVEDFTQKATIYTYDFFAHFSERMVAVGESLKTFFAGVGSWIGGTIRNSWTAQANAWDMFWTKAKKVAAGEDSFTLGDFIPALGTEEQKRQWLKGVDQGAVNSAFGEAAAKAWEGLTDGFRPSPEAQAALDAVAKESAERLEKAERSAAAVAEAAAAPRTMLPDLERVTASKRAGVRGSDSNAFLQGGTYAALTQGLRLAIRQDDQVRELRKGNGLLRQLVDGVRDLSAGQFDGMGVLA